MAKLTSLSATLLLTCYTLIYVLPFYLSTQTRPSPLISRDAPAVIRARIRSVSLSCLVCSVVTFGILLAHFGGRSDDDGNAVLHALHLMGYWPLGLRGAVGGLGLTGVLFAGPLFEGRIMAGRRRWLFGWVGDLWESLSGWTGWRNYVAGPLTEEILFRSCALPLFIISDSNSHSNRNTSSSLPTLLLVPPLIFGLAHIHHFHEFRLTNPHVPLSAALVRSLFQLSYTTLFGVYATFLYLRTGSLVGVVLVHGFCNWMGLPRVWGRVEGPERLGEGFEDGVESVLGPDDGGGGKSHQDSGMRDRELGIGWTVAYYVLLVAGAVGFSVCLWPLTESDGALITF